MITTGDVMTILCRDAQPLGIPEIYRNGEIPSGPVTTERVTVSAEKQESATYWNRGSVQINLCIPDTEGQANSARLTELEQAARQLFDRITAVHNTTRYRYSVESTCQERNTEQNYHYVNVRLLFETLNC